MVSPLIGSGLLPAEFHLIAAFVEGGQHKARIAWKVFAKCPLRGWEEQEQG